MFTSTATATADQGISRVNKAIPRPGESSARTAAMSAEQDGPSSARLPTTAPAPTKAKAEDDDLTSIPLQEDEDTSLATSSGASQLPPIHQSRASIQSIASASSAASTATSQQQQLRTSASLAGTAPHTPYEVFGESSGILGASGTSHASAGRGASGSLPTGAAAPPPEPPVILGIAVVDFNHLVGPQIEFAHPNSLLDDQDLSSNLPFLALPDGSHLSDEDFCYFHLYAPNLWPSTIFGISCNRQIASDALLRKGAEVTRSTVQKAVVVLAREPVFGPIREKLGIVTRAFFAQGDLADINILIDFHATLEAGLQSGGFSTDREAALYMGTSLREFIFKWRFKTLVLVKLLLLQRNIMFYGYPIEQLCTQQYSLVSLIPGLLASLQDAGLPSLDTRTATRVKAESLRTSDRKSLLRFLGLPLNLFGEQAFFQPYLPLQQIDLLKGSTYLVGTSNSIYRQQKDCNIDVIVDLEHSTLDFVNPVAQKISALTAADRKWMSELEQLVLSTWNPADPSRPAGMQYEGSDDHLRARFEDYISAMLASVKHSQFDKRAGKADTALAGASASSTQAFGSEFLEAFTQTKAFPSWDQSTDPMIFDIVDHRHPCDGKTSALEDVGLRLAAGLQDMHLEENLAAPARQAIGSAISVGGAGLYKFASGLRSEVTKLREGRLGGSGGAGDSPSPAGGSREASSRPRSPGVSLIGGFRIPGAGSSSSSTSSSTPAIVPSSTGSQFSASGSSSSSSASSITGTTAGGASSSTTTTTTTTATQLADVAAQTADRAAAAAAQAGTQVRAALGSFGSFLAKQQRQWAEGGGASGGLKSPTTTAAAAAGSPSPSPSSSSFSASALGGTGAKSGTGPGPGSPGTKSAFGSGWTSLLGGGGGVSSAAPSTTQASSTAPPPPPPIDKDVPSLPVPAASEGDSAGSTTTTTTTAAETDSLSAESDIVVESGASLDEEAGGGAGGAGEGDEAGTTTTTTTTTATRYPPAPNKPTASHEHS